MNFNYIFLCTLCISSIMCAMESIPSNTNLFALAAKIEENPNLYLTHNKSNPVVKQLKDVILDFKAEEVLLQKGTPFLTKEKILNSAIPAMESAGLLLARCMRERKEFSEKYTGLQANMEKQQKSAITYKCDAEELGKQVTQLKKEIKDLESAQKSLHSDIEKYKNLTKQNKTKFDDAIFYRNIFAFAFFISTGISDYIIYNYMY